jgi:PTS system nitrogen regulatory IIA component
MTFWKQFKPKSCSIHLEALTKETVLREIVDTMVSGGALEETRADAAFAALIERETVASTGVGHNIAIPHVKLAGLEQAVASLCVHPAGVEWAAVDGEPVHVLFTVLRPDKAGNLHDPERHLEMMRWVARLARERDFRQFALQVRTRTELVDLLKEMSKV